MPKTDLAVQSTGEHAAKVVDLAAFRQKRAQARQAPILTLSPLMYTAPLAWTPVIVWVPVWPTR